MKIVHIAHITHELGGVNIAVPQMIKSQQNSADVCLLNINNLKIDGVKNQISMVEFENMLSSEYRPDIVVFHEVYRIGFIPICIRLVKKNIPYIIVPHGCLTKQAQSKKRMKKIAGNLLIFNNFVKNASSIHYLSVREQKKSVFRKDCFVIGNGVKTPARSKRDFNTDRTKIVYIGRLEVEIKGLDILMEAVHNCKKELEESNSSITIYGPDYDTSHAKITNLIKKYNLSSLVTVENRVVGDEKEEILLGADYFIQSSRSEGMPMGLLEALSYGLPCIVTEGTGMGEIIHEYQAGYRCETNAHSIAKGLIKAIEGKDELHVMSSNAKILIEENFEQTTIASKIVSEYNQIIGRKGNRCF